MTEPAWMTVCRGCGRVEGDVIGPRMGGEPFYNQNCSYCPPWVCDDCGKMDSMADPCSCWIFLDKLNHADAKALFAGMDLSLETPDVS